MTILSHEISNPHTPIMAKNVSYAVRRLKVKNIDSVPMNQQSSTLSRPCVSQLNELLTCWRLNGVDSSQCANAVAALRKCRKEYIVRILLLLSIMYKLFSNRLKSAQIHKNQT